MPPLSYIFDAAAQRACHDVSSSHSTFSAIVSSKSPISTPEKSRTKVSFDSNVHIFEHIHRNDYSGEEQRSCFLAPNDYTEMRAERKITLKLMEGGQPTVNDGKKYYRGLEAKTREGFRRKQFHMVDAAMTVLDEQSLQAQNEICDTRVISKLYISCTAHCVRAAQERGLIDQQAALEPVSVAAQPPCPRRQPRRLSYTAA